MSAFKKGWGSIHRSLLIRIQSLLNLCDNQLSLTLGALIGNRFKIVALTLCAAQTLHLPHQ